MFGCLFCFLERGGGWVICSIKLSRELWIILICTWLFFKDLFHALFNASFLIHTLKYMYHVHLTYLALQELCVSLKFCAYCWTWTSILFHFTLMVMYEIVHFGPFHANPRCFRHILTTALFYQWWITNINTNCNLLRTSSNINHMFVYYFSILQTI